MQRWRPVRRWRPRGDARRQPLPAPVHAHIGQMHAHREMMGGGRRQPLPAPVYDGSPLSRAPLCSPAQSIAAICTGRLCLPWDRSSVSSWRGSRRGRRTTETYQRARGSVSGGPCDTTRPSGARVEFSHLSAAAAGIADGRDVARSARLREVMYMYVYVQYVCCFVPACSQRGAGVCVACSVLRHVRGQRLSVSPQSLRASVRE